MADLVAVAIVREDPPRVFMADDLDTLHWVLALRLVAAEPGDRLDPGVRDSLRNALREERWADAVVEWIGQSGVAVDVYESEALYRSTDVELGSAELQFSPLFQAVAGRARRDPLP